MRISFTMSYKQWTNRDKLFNVAHEFFTEESAIESYWFLSACYQLLHLILSNKSELKYLFYTDSKMINLVRHYLCDQIHVFIYRECLLMWMILIYVPKRKWNTQTLSLQVSILFSKRWQLSQLLAYSTGAEATPRKISTFMSIWKSQ